MTGPTHNVSRDVYTRPVSVSFAAASLFAGKLVGKLEPLDPLAMAATTSYDFWWPYPPWGATTTVPTPTALPPTVAVSSASSVLGTVSATNVLSSAARPVVETSNLVSSTSSASIIRITALPPSNGTTSQKYSGDHTGFDVAYLAPLFAVLAAIVGALSTWYLLRWRARRRDRQAHGSSFLHTGPRYAPPPEYSEHSVPQGSNSSSGSSAHEASTLLQGHTDPEKKGWISRAFSRSSRQSQAVSMIPPVTPVGRQPSTRDPSNMINNPYSAVDDDPPVDNSRAMHLGHAVSQQSGAHLTANVTSPDMLSPGSDDVPYETLRHKSIRRAILERLKFGTLRRPVKTRMEDQPDVESGRIQNSPARRVSSRRGHRRNDSDFNVEDIRRQDVYPSRANSVARGMDGRSPMMSPPGFRIIEEDTESPHPGEHARLMGTSRREEGSDVGTPARENPAWKWIASWSPSPSIRTEDSYTALPVRRVTTKKGGPASAAPSLPRTDEYPSALPEITRVDSSILPSSPPQVMSPPLHSRLFFSDFGSSPSLDLNLTKEQAGVAVARTTTSTPERQVHKLQTKRESEPLPFPSTSGPSPYRGRLKKPRAVPATSPPLPCSPEVVALDLPRHTPVSPITPYDYDEQVYAERLLARQSALDKVGEIVSRGLSQRDMAASVHKAPADIRPVVAPDRGTRMEVRDGVGATMGHGIEQRLGLLRESESAVLDPC